MEVFFVELIKRNIHMDHIRVQAVTQFTLEDDVNLPENKPDIAALNLEKGEVLIDEIKPGTDAVTVRGRLMFVVLYHTQEEGSSLVVMEGRLPFEEKVNIQGVVPGDAVTVDGKVKFACVDGPEFDGHGVNFDEAMRRQTFYRTEEGRAILKLQEGDTHHGGCGNC